MKREKSSVLMLFTRASFYPAVLTLLLMLILEIAVFLIFGMKADPEGMIRPIDQAVEGVEIILKVISFVGLMVLSVILGTSLTGRNARPDYSLAMLRISERKIWGLQVLNNALVFLMYWGVQVIAFLLMFKLYEMKAAEPLGAQALYAACHRIGIISGFIPLERAFRWIANILYITALSILNANAASGMRMNRNGSGYAFSGIIACGMILGNDPRPHILAFVIVAAFFGASVVKLANCGKEYGGEGNV